MKQIHITIPPDEVTKIVQDHINKMLDPKLQARATCITTGCTGSSQPGIPDVQLSVTFNVAELRS